MPQIWPMNWVTLFTLFTLTFVIFLTFNYFLNPAIKFTQLDMDGGVHQPKSMEWKW